MFPKLVWKKIVLLIQEVILDHLPGHLQSANALKISDQNLML